MKRYHSMKKMICKSAFWCGKRIILENVENKHLRGTTKVRAPRALIDITVVKIKEMREMRKTLKGKS